MRQLSADMATCKFALNYSPCSSCLRNLWSALLFVKNPFKGLFVETWEESYIHDSSEHELKHHNYRHTVSVAIPVCGWINGCIWDGSVCMLPQASISAVINKITQLCVKSPYHLLSHILPKSSLLKNNLFAACAPAPCWEIFFLYCEPNQQQFCFR